MKKLTPLLFLFPSLLSGQMIVDHPDKVYPILEEFVSKNYERGTHTLEILNSIDSIIVKDLGWDRTDPDFPIKNYGFHYRKTNGRNMIEIDVSLLEFPWRFERTLKHELGHVFRLPHLQDKKDEMEFMSEHHYIYYIEPSKWKELNIRYYESLTPR